jgi:hypothetical protein
MQTYGVACQRERGGRCCGGELSLRSAAECGQVKRTAADVMTPFHHIKMIPLDAKLDEYTLASLVATGHRFVLHADPSSTVGTHS